jgi:hypothetical protein
MSWAQDPKKLKDFAFQPHTRLLSEGFDLTEFGGVAEALALLRRCRQRWPPSLKEVVEELVTSHPIFQVWDDDHISFVHAYLLMIVFGECAIRNSLTIGLRLGWAEWDDMSLASYPAWLDEIDREDPVEDETSSDSSSSSSDDSDDPCPPRARSRSPSSSDSDFAGGLTRVKIEDYDDENDTPVFRSSFHHINRLPPVSVAHRVQTEKIKTTEEAQAIATQKFRQGARDRAQLRVYEQEEQENQI